MFLNKKVPKIVDVVIEEEVKIVTTGAGTPKLYMPKLKDAGIKVMPVISNVKIAKKMENLGVDAFQKDHNTVVGEAPKILKHLMEIRGIGIIDVMNLFGAGAVKNRTEIQLVINLVNWDPKANYDRLGFQENTREICNVPIPQVNIPVKVGRNIEIIIEVAAMNFRAKKMGYDATQTFDNNLTSLISEHSKEDTNKVPHND